MTDPLSVPCPICDAQPGDLCQDAVRGYIGPVERPDVYTSVAAEVSE